MFAASCIRALRSVIRLRARGFHACTKAHMPARPSNAPGSLATVPGFVDPRSERLGFQPLYPDVTVAVRDWNNQVVRQISLPGMIFNVPIRPDIIQRVVVWQLAKRRQGTHKTKTRSEVSGTRKKAYAQKGTGGARHGNLRAPQFRHGGVAHGPRPRSYEFSLPSRVRKLGLRIALSSKVHDGRLIVLEDAAVQLPADTKTKALAAKLESLGLTSALLLVGPVVDLGLKRSSANLRRVLDVLPQQGANVYDIVRRRELLLTPTSIAHLTRLLA